MKRYPLSARLGLVVLTALSTLPISQSASLVDAKPRTRIVARTFSNTTSIRVQGSSTSPNTARLIYPGTIDVDGLKGTIRDVNLTLHAFEHQAPDEVQVLLRGPRGETAVVMADVGGDADVAGVTLRLDDEAAGPLPDAATLQSGTFRPTNATGNVIAFVAPAPSAGASSALSVFDGTNPNGRWRLFVQDDNGPFHPGAFKGGWTLEIEAQVKSKKKR